MTYLQINALYELVNEFKDSIEVMNFEPYEKTTANGGDFTYEKIPNTNITMSKYPQLCLFQDNNNFRIFLFLLEVNKLVKYRFEY